MLMFKAKKVAALALVMLLVLSGNVMGAFAEQAVNGEAQAAVDALLMEDNAASSEGSMVAVEAPAAEVLSVPEEPVEQRTEEPQHFDPMPIVYSVKYVAPDGSEYFIIEVEEGDRLSEPMFTPMLAGYVFEYWYEMVPISEGNLELGMAEARIEFNTPVTRDYIIIAKLTAISEMPVAANEEAGQFAGAEEEVRETRASRREERKQTAEIIEVVGARAAGELLMLEGLEILIISDTDPILGEDEEEAEETDEIVIEDEEEGEASDEAEETEAVVIEDEEEEDETSEDETSDEEETVVEEETTAEEDVIIEEDDTDAMDGELDMQDAAVPLAGRAVNVYTNHKPMMVEGETLEVWGELIGFDNVDVKVQWQFSEGGGVWQDMPGANDMSYAVSATGDTVNYAWRLAVAVIGK